MSTINYNQLSPQSSRALFALSETTKESSIEPSLRELIKIRASQLNGCALCLDMHIKEARMHGERELRVHHIAAWHDSPLFTEREKAALDWTEKVTRLSPTGIHKEEVEQLKKYFSEKEISDLTFVIVIINAWNRFGVAFQGVPGSYDKLLGLDKAGLN